MQKHKLMMLSAVLVLVLLMNSCGALFMSNEAEDLVGFWVSEGWNDYGSDYCYYDFRENGRVYVTDWTDDMPFHDYWMMPIPVYFNYTVEGDTVTMSQYFGITNFEFETVSDLSSDNISLSVIETSGDYSNVDRGDTLFLTRIIDYSDEQAAAARTFLQEYGNE